MRRSHLLVLLLVMALGAALWWFHEGPRSADVDRTATSRVAGPDATDAIQPPERRPRVPDSPGGAPQRERRAAAVLGRDLTGKVVVTVRTHDGEPAVGVPVIGGSMDAEGVFVTLMGEYGLPRTDALGRVGIDPDEVEERYAAQYFGLRQAMADIRAPREIVLPPLGAVAVDLGAFRSDATVSIRIDAYGSEHDSVDAGGVCRFDHVPLGETFSGLVRSDGRLTRFEFAGPAAAGEVVTVAPDPAPALRVRARPLGPDGAPIADERFDLVDADGRRVCILDDGDGDGRVEADVEEERWEITPGDAIELRERRVGVPDEGAPYVALEAPAPDAEGVVDLGTLQLAPPPLLAAGVVVDGRGRPVARAAVRANRRRAWEPERPTRALGYGGGSRLPRDRAGDAPVVRVAEARTDRRGRFELRVRADRIGDPERLVLVASARRPDRSTSARLRPGASDHRLVLGGDGALVIDPAGIPGPVREFVSAKLHSRDRRAWVRDLGALRGTVERSVPPGRYLLEMRFGRFFLAEFDDIVVPVEALCADPRLAPLALPDAFEARRLRVLDRSGAAVEPDRLWYGAGWDPLTGVPTPEPVGDPRFHRLDGTGAVTWTAVVDPARRAFIGAPGHLPAEITSIVDGGSVTLERLERVRLVFQGASPPGPGELASIQLLHNGGAPDPTALYESNAAGGAPTVHATVVPGRRHRIRAAAGSPWQGVRFIADVDAGAVAVRPD